MKISTDVNRALSNDTAQSARHSGGTSPVRSTNAAPAIGSVRISEASRSLQVAGSSNAEAPFDAQRVEAIKAAISSGHFKVDPEKIADKVLDSASQLLVGKG